MICSVRSHNDVIKTTIPVQSTMLSTGFIIFFSGLSAYLINVTQDLHLRPYDRPIGKGLLIVALAAQMPLILGLTVKNQQKNQRPSPPPGLQFHGVSANLKKNRKNIFLYTCFSLCLNQTMKTRCGLQLNQLHQLVKALLLLRSKLTKLPYNQSQFVKIKQQEKLIYLLLI